MSKDRQVARFTKLMREWLGDGGIPVDRSQSEWRATVCIACPMNRGGGFWGRIKRNVASLINETIAVRNRLEVSTPYDSKLQICSVCHCALKLKVHVPLKFLLETLNPDHEEEFRSVRCWIMKEKDSYELLRSQKMP